VTDRNQDDTRTITGESQLYLQLSWQRPRQAFALTPRRPAPMVPIATSMSAASNDVARTSARELPGGCPNQFRLFPQSDRPVGLRTNILAGVAVRKRHFEEVYRMVT